MTLKARQLSTVPCTYLDANWEINSTGETACTVWAQLGNVCSPGFSVAPITQGVTTYHPIDDPCQCNIVAYNLMSGCGWCQDAIQISDLLPISEWGGNCTTSTFDGTGIPTSVDVASINIPLWAFAVPTGTSWNPLDAEFIADGLTSTTSSSLATVTALPSITVSPTFNTGRTSTRPIPSGINANNFSNDGARAAGTAVGIALGVIFGFAALVAIIVGVVYYRRQKKRKALYGPMAQFYQGGGTYGTAPTIPLMYGQDPSMVYQPQHQQQQSIGTNPYNTLYNASRTPTTTYSSSSLPLNANPTMMAAYPPVPPIPPNANSPYIPPSQLPTGAYIPPTGPPAGAAPPNLSGGGIYRGAAEVY